MEEQRIRLIAVDMDGTFLNSDGTYDRPRFAELAHRFVDRGVQFVVASGNQYQTLKNFFEDYPNNYYIAENGAVLATSEIPFATTQISDETARIIEQLLETMPGTFTIVSTAEMAYYPSSCSAETVQRMSRYYANLTPANGLSDIKEPIVKFALNCAAEETLTLFNRLKAELPEDAVPTSSGNGAIDIIPASINKGVALERLGEKLGISAEEMVAFGDGGNDIEMLKYVGTGVAMENAPENVKAVADAVAVSNNESGVMAWLEVHLR